MGRSAEVTMTFAVTFKAPKGMSIPTARALIKDALRRQVDLGIEADKDVKVHLTNKETKYA